MSDGCINGTRFTLDPLVKWILGIVGVVIAAGIIGSMAMLRESSLSVAAVRTDVAVLSAKLDAFTEYARDNREGIVGASASVKAIELSVLRIDANHSVLTAEAAELRRRIDALEGK
jgi:hypothetical protein